MLLFLSVTLSTKQNSRLPRQFDMGVAAANSHTHTWGYFCFYYTLGMQFVPVRYAFGCLIKFHLKNVNKLLKNSREGGRHAKLSLSFASLGPTHRRVDAALGTGGFGDCARGG